MADTAIQRRVERPDPEWVRGLCPVCGEELISECEWILDRGYVIFWACWGSKAEPPTCRYFRAL